MGERFLFMPAPTRGILPIEYWLEPKYGSRRAVQAPELSPEDREWYARHENTARVQKAGGKFRKAVAKSKRAKAVPEAPTWESHLEKHPEDREQYNRTQNKIRVREAGGKFRKAVVKSKRENAAKGVLL